MKKFLFTIVMLFTIFSCGGSNAPKDTIVLNLGEEGSTLDTSKLTDNVSGTTHGMLTEGLAKIDKNYDIVPGLAKSITESKDGLSYDIVLRDDIKWSNGQPITSDDFLYAWQRALDPKTASEYAYILYPIKNAQDINDGKLPVDKLGVDVLSPKHFVIHLERSTPYFYSLLSFTTYLPINREFAEKLGNNYALEKENLLYSGPYMIDKWVHGSEIDLVKNPYYYDKDNIKINKVVIKYIADSSSSLNAFKNEETDVHELTAEQFDEYKNAKNVYSKQEAGFFYLLINFNNKILKNKNIRKAISLAIDPKQIVSSVFNNVTAEAANTITPVNAGFKGKKKDFVKELYETGFKGYEYNVPEAKKYLKKGLKELGLKELPPLSIIANDSGANKKVIEFIQEQLRKNLDIKINIELMTYKERLARMHAGTFDMAYAGWYADFLDPINFLDLFYIDNGNNNGKYNNPKYNELISKAYNETDANKRIDLLMEAERMVAEDVASIPIIQPQRKYLYNPKIKNLLFPSFGPVYDVKFAEIEK